MIDVGVSTSELTVEPVPGYAASTEAGDLAPMLNDKLAAEHKESGNSPITVATMEAIRCAQIFMLH